ncbi:hypothetical protein HJG60_010553 [Phyllostomus discolor]|uniref:Uncharacterized protein n=1 Tax=Phyllostomus discolor TaxID=89673 RepID=A0A834AH40_9CHIR|nr:hypothetical protein HJG60_010553 [Phyllostomus discolor]
MTVYMLILHSSDLRSPPQLPQSLGVAGGSNWSGTVCEMPLPNLRSSETAAQTQRALSEWLRQGEQAPGRHLRALPWGEGAGSQCISQLGPVRQSWAALLLRDRKKNTHFSSGPSSPPTFPPKIK